MRTQLPAPKQQRDGTFVKALAGREQRLLCDALLRRAYFMVTESISSMGRVYTRAYELCQTVDDVRQRVLTAYGLFLFHENRAQLYDALGLAQELLRLGQKQEDLAIKLVGHRAWQTFNFSLGGLTTPYPIWKK
jgi:hypothetical protein